VGVWRGGEEVTLRGASGEVQIATMTFISSFVLHYFTETVVSSSNLQTLAVNHAASVLLLLLQVTVVISH